MDVHVPTLDFTKRSQLKQQRIAELPLGLQPETAVVTKSSIQSENAVTPLSIDLPNKRSVFDSIHGPSTLSKSPAHEQSPTEQLL